MQCYRGVLTCYNDSTDEHLAPHRRKRFYEEALLEKVGVYMSSIAVVLDACVLFPAYLRDTLLSSAAAGLYRLQLTDDILEEVRRNLVKKGIQELNAKRLVDEIKRSFPQALVLQHGLLIPSMPINEKDRHVLAAAVASGSQIIVTKNLKDFPAHLLQPFDIEAQSPDDFLVNQFYLDPKFIIEILENQANALRKPPKTLRELLETLNQHAPKFVDLAHHSLDDEDLRFWG